MTEGKKLNLSAMIKKADLPEIESEEKANSTKENQETKLEQIDHIDEQTTADKKIGVKISISSIKSEKVEEESEPIEEKIEEPKDEKELYYESLTSKIAVQDKTDTADKENEKTTESSKDFCTIKDKEKIIKENKESSLFNNYESDYKKQESKILDTIQKLKNLADIKKMTKTNKIFVFGIITVTILGVGMLFYVDPKTHSLENYKASILTIAGKQVTHEEMIQEEETIQKEIQWKLQENKLGGYELNFELKVNDMGEAVYRFDGLDYSSKADLNEAIKEKLNILKKQKLRDYLKNKLKD